MMLLFLIGQALYLSRKWKCEIQEKNFPVVFKKTKKYIYTFKENMVNIKNFIFITVTDDNQVVVRLSDFEKKKWKKNLF